MPLLVTMAAAAAPYQGQRSSPARTFRPVHRTGKRSLDTAASQPSEKSHPGRDRLPASAGSDAWLSPGVGG